MKQLTLTSVRTWIRRLTELAIDDECAPADLVVVLREEASRLAENEQCLTEDDAYVYVLPSDDSSVDSRDVLATVIAGSVGARKIRFHGLELRHPGREHWASMWAVHDADTGAFHEWLNAGTFRTTADLEAHLHEVDANDTDD